METDLRDLEIDVALLPINGRDPAREARGIVGNLGAREAAWLASQAAVDLVIPMHHDLFARNLGFPAHLVESVEREHPGVPVFGPLARPAVRLLLHETAMKALVYLGPRRMQVQDVPEPVAGRDEIVIASRASAICGSDLHGFREASPRRIPPLVMGHETVGQIAAVGEGIDPARVGERVVLRPALACGECAPCLANRPNLCRNGRLVGRDLGGGFAERFVAPASAGVPIDDDVPDDLATLIEPVANAVHVTTRAVVARRPGARDRRGPDRRAHGARRGARRRGVGVRHRPRRRETRGSPRARELRRLPARTPRSRSTDFTEGQGFDVVIDAAGFAATWALAVQAVRPGGRIEVVGLGTPAGAVDYFAVIGKEAVITGSFAWTDEDFARAVALVEGGQIDATGLVHHDAARRGRRGVRATRRRRRPVQGRPPTVGATQRR